MTDKIDDPTDLQPEYIFDYATARPNRFAGVKEGSRVVGLEPDIAEVFETSNEVNAVLRALIQTMPRRSE